MAGYTEQRLIPFPSFLFPYFFEQWSSLHLFSFHEMLFPLLVANIIVMYVIINYAEAIYAQVDKAKKAKKNQLDNSFKLDSPPPVNKLDYEVIDPLTDPEVVC